MIQSVMLGALILFVVGYVYVVSDEHVYVFESVFIILALALKGINYKASVCVSEGATYLSRSIWISVEGNISSGKSTLIANLKERARSGSDFGLPGYDIRFIDEDIESWGADLFANFYKDPARWAFTFQFKVIAGRAQQIRNTCNDIQLAKRPALVISERSLESSRSVFMKMCCEAGNITPVEKRVYDECYCILAEIAHTDLYIYCTTPPIICKERYVKRAREGEVLDINYLISCHCAHADWLCNNTNDRVVSIDTSENISSEALQRWHDIFIKSIHSVNDS